MLPEIERFQKWLRRRAPNASTPIHYTNDLSLFFNWLGKPVVEVTVQDIDAFIEYSQSLGHAILTINRRLAALRSFYHFLGIEMEKPPRNPVLPKRHFIRLGQKLPRDVQDSNIERLFQMITGPRDRAIFLLMLRCGLRVGEVRNLSLPDLYLEPSSGLLPRLWLRGKGGRERVAYLSPQSLAALQVWMEMRPHSKDNAVFLNRFGHRMTITGIQDRLAVYCRQAGLWITCHQLRHTFARHIIEQNVPVTTLQRLLGHIRLRTTEVYLHVSDRQVQTAYEAAMREVEHRLNKTGGPL